jgi:hypothetical protein
MFLDKRALWTKVLQGHFGEFKVTQGISPEVDQIEHTQYLGQMSLKAIFEKSRSLSACTLFEKKNLISTI